MLCFEAWTFPEEFWTRNFLGTAEAKVFQSIDCCFVPGLSKCIQVLSIVTKQLKKFVSSLNLTRIDTFTLAQDWSMIGSPFCRDFSWVQINVKDGRVRMKYFMTGVSTNLWSNKILSRTASIFTVWHRNSPFRSLFSN